MFRQYIWYVILPVAFGLAHTFLVLWVWVVSSDWHNPGGDWIWLLFDWVDRPAWRVTGLEPNNSATGIAVIVGLGGLQWFTVGLAIQVSAILFWKVLLRLDPARRRDARPGSSVPQNRAGT